MDAQLDRLQQSHPVSVREIKEKLQALRKQTSSSSSSTVIQGRRAPLAVRHDGPVQMVGEDSVSHTILNSKRLHKSHSVDAGPVLTPATKRQSRKPSPPPPPVRPPEAPVPPLLSMGGEAEPRPLRTKSDHPRSSTPTSRSVSSRFLCVSLSFDEPCFLLALSFKMIIYVQ